MPLNVYNIYKLLYLCVSLIITMSLAGKPPQLLIDTVWTDTPYAWTHMVLQYAATEFERRSVYPCANPTDHHTDIGYLFLHRSSLDGRTVRRCNICHEMIYPANLLFTHQYSGDVNEILDCCTNCAASKKLLGSYCSSVTFTGSLAVEHTIWLYHRQLKPSSKTKSALFGKVNKE